VKSNATTDARSDLTRSAVDWAVTCPPAHHGTRTLWPWVRCWTAAAAGCGFGDGRAPDEGSDVVDPRR